MEFSEDEEIEIAHSTHAGMLHDDERHEKYYEALKLLVSEWKEDNSGPLTALDIGCGTGILSMMAASCGCDHVTACEASEPMSNVAINVIQSNGLSEKITVIGKTSSDVNISQDMERKADILVTEIFDSELIGEGVLPTLRDAHVRLLKPGCKVVPSSADINVQLIQSDRLNDMNKINFDWLSMSYPKGFDECHGFAAAHELHVDQLYPNDIQLLSDAHKQSCFSFTKPFNHNFIHNNSKYSATKIQIKATKSGKLHGVLLWWDLILHEKGNIVLSMKPKWMARMDEEILWREHWMQAVYYLPNSFKVDVNDILSVTMFHDDFSIWFDVTKEISAIDNVYCHHDFIDRPLCSCGLHLTCPREKFAMLNDKSMHRFFKKLVSHFEQYRDCTLTILGDMSILPLLFSKYGFRNLKYVECNPFSKYTIRELFECSDSVQKIDIVNLGSTDLSTVTSELVMCEPYLASSLLPWQHLRLWQRLHEITTTNHNMNLSFPHKAVLKGCLVRFEHLSQIREPVRNIKTFDLRDYDNVVQQVLAPLKVDGHGSFHAVEPFLMFEYEHNLASEVFVLKEFDFKEPICEDIVSFHGKINIRLPNGIAKDDANAIVLWIDYKIASDLTFFTGLNDENDWVGYSKQGIYFLRNQTVKESHLVNYNILFYPVECDLLFDFKFS